MGREIRRVPKDWDHPKGDDGHYRPLYDQTFDDALAEWIREYENFKAGGNETAKSHYASRGITERQIAADPAHYFADWHGSPPDPKYYRPAWAGLPSCYQVYETVSEGTPTSPVFNSLDEMEIWLVKQGYSVAAAAEFTKGGWAPSMVYVPGQGILRDIESLVVKPATK